MVVLTVVEQPGLVPRELSPRWLRLHDSTAGRDNVENSMLLAVTGQTRPAYVLNGNEEPGKEHGFSFYSHLFERETAVEFFGTNDPRSS